MNYDSKTSNSDYTIIKDLPASRGEKLLLYLYQFREKFNKLYKEPLTSEPWEITQEGIEEHLGIRQGNIHEVIKDLHDSSKIIFIDSKKAHITGISNKRKVYGLSEEGIKYAENLMGIYKLDGKIKGLKSEKITKPEDTEIIEKKIKDIIDKIENLVKILFISFEKIESIYFFPIYIACEKTVLGENVEDLICIISPDIIDDLGKDKKNIFDQIINKMIMLQKKYKINISMIISPEDIDYNFKRMANKKKIKILILKEIEERLLQWSELRKKVISEYKENPLSKSFVDARCCYDEKNIFNKTKSLPISKAFSDFIYDDNHSCLLLFGDFGTGKTSAGVHLVYSICKEEEEENVLPNIYPIYIRLKDYQKIQKPISFIINDINRKYGLSIEEQVFRKFLKEKSFLVILDGFDEMDIMVDRSNILKNLQLLKSLSNYTNIKYIITCRTHLFRYDLSIVDDENTTLLFLYPWEKEEWETYSKKLFGNNWQNFYNKIKNSKNLKNLCQTPRFLYMLANKPNISPQISEGELFESYISEYLSEEEKSHLLSKSERELMLEGIAVNMLKGGELSISFDNIVKTAKDIFRDRDYSYIDLERIANDIIISTLMVRNKIFPDNFEFANPSFFEFFIAKRILKEIGTNSFDILNEKDIPISILCFSADLLLKDKELKDVFNLYKSCENVYAKSNLLYILSFLSPDPSNILRQELTTDNPRSLKYTAVRLIRQFDLTIPINQFIALYKNEKYEPLRRELVNAIKIKREQDKSIIYDLLINICKNDPSPEISNIALDIIESNIDNDMRKMLVNEVGELKQLRHKEKILHILGENPSIDFIKAYEILVNDDNAEIRQISIEDLAKIDSKKSNEIIIKKLKNDPDPWVRKHCAISLSTFNNPTTIKSLSNGLTNDSDEEVRKMCARSLGTTKDPTAADALIEALKNDSMAIVRWYSAEALGQIGDKRAIPILKDKMKNDLHHIVRKYCRKALENMGGEYE